MTRNFLGTFPAFKHKNYQLYFAAQLVSLIGTWLQMIAQGWLILQLTQSAFMVGLVSALGFLPVMFFSLFGGVLVDRFPKKELIIFTQVSQMILALILGLAAILGFANVWLVATLSFLLGITNALDMPARQAFTIELVGRKDMSSAVALNMGAFNVARVIGPAMAGILIAKFGNGGAFLLNGLSFIAPIMALYFMKIDSAITKVHTDTFEAIKEGLRYAKNHQLIKNLLIFTVITAIFGWSYTTMLPVIAQNIFHKDATGLGMLYSAAGLGALGGTIFVSGYSRKFSVKSIILAGSLIFAISVILFSLTNNFLLGLFFMFFSGVGIAIQVSLLNSTIQHNVSDELRGRVMSIYTLAFLGMAPIGSFQIGFVSQHFGTQLALIIGAVMIFIFSIYLYFSLSKIKES